MDMRITLRVQIPEASVNRNRFLYDINIICRHQVTWCSWLHTTAGPLQQKREPADFEAGTGADHQICTPALSQKAGSRPDMMMILP